MFDNKDFIRAVFDTEVRSQQTYLERLESQAATRATERRASPERRQHEPWVVDSNDRRSGYDRRTGLDRRGNRGAG